MPKPDVTSKSDKSVSDVRMPMPTAPLVLGAAGLMPFLFLSAALVLDNGPAETTVRAVLLAYSIAILSFMGAVHWGLAMKAGAKDPQIKDAKTEDAETTTEPQDWRRYALSVVPALAATATVFVPPRFQFFWLGAWFLALLAYDVAAGRRGEVPGWYPNLRWALTLIVCVCLGVAGLRG